MPASGPHAGQCCFPPPPDLYDCLGSETTLAHLPAYVTGSPTAPSVVLFICDIYGWKVPQTRRLADKVAAAGHYVILPDFMEGDFFSSSDPENPYKGLDAYLARRSQPKAIAEAGLVIRKLKAEGFQRVGVAGFCWGGKITVSLLNDDKVDAAVMLHPSFLLMEEIKAVKVPLAILAAEIDVITPPEMAMEFGSVLAGLPEVGSKSLVKIFKGADHGWTTRYDPQDKEAVEQAEEAHNDMLSWFTRFLTIAD